MSVTSSLALSRLTCHIPDYQAEILKLIQAKGGDPLYVEFIRQFFIYLPVDYQIREQFELFTNFSDKAFLFFKNRKIGQRKITITQSSLYSDPAITILLINDNKPFIVDSLSCLFTRLALQPRFILHPVIYCTRDSNGELQKIVNKQHDQSAESLLYIKILGNYDQAMISLLDKEINHTLDQVDATYNTWPVLLQKIQGLVKGVKNNEIIYENIGLRSYSAEIVSFLEWLQHNNFTFLGSIDFDISSKNFISEQGATSIWQDNIEELQNIINFSSQNIYQNTMLILGKINRLSPVHRSNLVDYILVKKLDQHGKYTSGTIILGLYGSAIYYQSIINIPILRQKLRFVLDRSGFPLGGYNSKKLKIIIESLPREALIQIDETDLYCMCLHMLSSMMSRKLKLFIQQDWSGAFINVLIFLPKARLTPEIHNSINIYLAAKLKGKILLDNVTEVVQDFSHLFVTLAVQEKIEFKVEEIENDVDQLSTSWGESFYHQLCKNFGEYQASLNFKIFEQTFPADYRHKFTATIAVQDLISLQKASSNGHAVFNLIPINNIDFQLKIYSPEKKLILSNILPFIENLGFKAIDEQSFMIAASGNVKESWIYQFLLSAGAPIERDLQELAVNVEDALDKMAQGHLSADSLSKLVVLCGFNWHRIRLLRALTRYLHQTGFAYGKGYVQLTLIKHYNFTELLIALFEAKFNPFTANMDVVNQITDKVIVYLDTVTNSTEDKVLRSMFNLLEAMVRTNYYQFIDGAIKSYLSFKFNSKKIKGLPLPLPYAEIFVYSNDFEAIHLRGGKVARGGIRWSDRGEDYRIEVLGLMKAQMTKNAVIVPVGSKGGFVVFFGQDGLSYQEYMAKIIECYQNFLRGLLDITDNIIDGKITHPINTIIYDDQDPYLVVAADKGTATFSDYANGISAEYGFWLRDAFASGGSSGYDHKKMAITAKGAWISVQQHFQEIAIDVQNHPITVVGIGDMSGDVFGNGMLSSESIKLVAAFNHQHIFIDPDPDMAASFKERLRLFSLPRSKWSDYNIKLISKGGGIFERAAKLITISAEMKRLLDIQADRLSPEELIKVILQAQVDLIWNGGIGTYIKASYENNFEIGDKANDNLRCDALDIRATVIAEGGNLGVSQQGRIEYSKCGGRINTDFIDNSAGVDCSDHEVNIKIALNNAVANGKLTIVERDALLVNMTNQVESLVLMDNYKQTQAITITQLSTALNIEMFSQLISGLEEEKLLDRAVEFLPDTAELAKRSIAKEHLTRPELAILLSYSKMSVCNELVNAKLTEDKYFETYLIDYFPQIMRDKFQAEILSHPLKNEIIRTVVTNKIVNQLSGPIINTIKRETGGVVCDIVRAYIIVCCIFDLDNLWKSIESLGTNVNNTIKIDMLSELAKIMRRGSSWFIRNLEHPIDILKTINEFAEPARHLNSIIASLLLGEAKRKFDDRIEKYTAAGVELRISHAIATVDSLVSAFDIIYVAKQTNISAAEVAKLYFAVGNRFNIDWLRKSCEKQIDDSYWNRLSIQSLKDDLYDKQRRLLVKIINQSPIANIDLDQWLNNYQGIANIFFNFVEKIKLQEDVNLNMMILANKKFEMFLRKLG
ncbi:NAD-glutamate dehydrogenase [Candidatus Trichorickettsia mobilis]|uniref:NAD-glutamate dehydrogenase n=1 Tax=Candidatus Trichorickettsia mobilis TaxID=1346319 RepID=UPI00292DFF57|nr:NAD-glutamate dehydrogenase [Candidatus Trichorickettsia mobilis]